VIAFEVLDAMDVRASGTTPEGSLSNGEIANRDEPYSQFIM